MPKTSVLLIGSTQRNEFQASGELLERLAELTTAPDIAAACSLLEPGEIVPELIVLAQSHPGQYASADLDDMTRIAPLARVVVLLGGWCEGEARSGNPWPAGTRVYWHQWPARLSQEIVRLATGNHSTWGLPMTAGDEDRFLVLSGEPIRPQRGLIAIVSANFAMQDWLANACRQRGCQTVWLRPGQALPTSSQPAAGVFNGTELSGREREHLSQFVAHLAPSQVIALLDFPRVEQVRLAESAGAVAVLSKPVLLNDFDWQLDRMLSKEPVA